MSCSTQFTSIPFRFLSAAQRWVLKLTATALLCLPFTINSASAADDTFQCLNGYTGPLTSFEGEQPMANYDFFYPPDGARYDVRSAAFIQQTMEDPIINYPVDVRSNDSLCWAGGSIRSNNPEDQTWAENYEYNHAALISETAHITVDGVRIHNAHDGIRLRSNLSQTFDIRNVWITWNRDDCIENDLFASGQIEDSLFECYVFLSSRNKSDIPNANTVTVRNNVIHLRKMPGPAEWNDPTLYGHGALFKWDTQGPALNLHNNVFMIDQMPTTQGSLEGHADNAFGTLGFLYTTYNAKLNECSGNVIVWLGDGDGDGDFTDDDFPGDIPNDPSCVTVTRDRSVFDEARAAWIAGHPNVARLETDVANVDTGTTTSDTTTADTTTSDTTTTDTTTSDTTTADTTTSDTTTTDTTTSDTTTTDTTTSDTTTTPETDSELVLQDSQAPTVSIVTPFDNMTVFPATSQWIEVDALDNTGIARVEVFIDQEGPFTFEGDGSHGFSWTVPDGPKNKIKITAIAYDRFGNNAMDRVGLMKTGNNGNGGNNGKGPK